MSTLLEELAAKADCTIDGMGYGEGNLEYFAKLIMEECANVCNDFDCGRTMSSQELIVSRFGIDLK